MGIEEHDQEGRVITLEFEDFYFVTVYTPNSQDELKRLSYRMTWEDAFRAHLCRLAETKPVVAAGDMNVAHKEIDLKNPGPNRGNAGFSDQEREAFQKLLGSGFVDAYRYLYPDKVEYSWWSYMRNARANNAGWRIDYFLVSDWAADRIKECRIHTDIYGSDHAPVSLEIDI